MQNRKIKQKNIVCIKKKVFGWNKNQKENWNFLRNKKSYVQYVQPYSFYLHTHSKIYYPRSVLIICFFLFHYSSECNAVEPKNFLPLSRVPRETVLRAAENWLILRTIFLYLKQLSHKNGSWVEEEEALLMHLAKRESWRRQDWLGLWAMYIITALLSAIEPKIRLIPLSTENFVNVHAHSLSLAHLIKGSSHLFFLLFFCMLTDNKFYIERVAIKIKSQTERSLPSDATQLWIIFR